MNLPLCMQAQKNIWHGMFQDITPNSTELPAMLIACNHIRHRIITRNTTQAPDMERTSHTSSTIRATRVPPREDVQRKDRVRTVADMDPNMLHPPAPGECDKGSRTVSTSGRFRGAKHTTRMNVTHGTLCRPTRWNHRRHEAEDMTYRPLSPARHNDNRTHKPRKDSARNKRDSGYWTFSTFMGMKRTAQANAKHGTLCRTVSWNGGRGKPDGITYCSRNPARHN
eukprot:6068422-Pleurochrysis_carterae.AAC.1